MISSEVSAAPTSGDTSLYGNIQPQYRSLTEPEKRRRVLKFASLKKLLEALRPRGLSMNYLGLFRRI